MNELKIDISLNVFMNIFNIKRLSLFDKNINYFNINLENKREFCSYYTVNSDDVWDYLIIVESFDRLLDSFIYSDYDDIYYSISLIKDRFILDEIEFNEYDYNNILENKIFNLFSKD